MTHDWKKGWEPRGFVQIEVRSCDRCGVKQNRIPRMQGSPEGQWYPIQGPCDPVATGVWRKDGGTDGK